MPKAELHQHLDGSLWPETIARLASALPGSPLQGKTPAEIARLSVVAEARPSLAKVLEAFDVVLPLLRRPEAVEEAAYELARRASRSGVRYVEVRFAPALLTAAGFTAEDALMAADENRAMLDLALAYRGRGVAGGDVAGDEAAAPLSAYEPLLRKAKAAGLGLTVHAGEVPGSPDLATALALGEDRLGHATRLSDHPELLREVAARRIPIEVNLTSNLRTSAVADLRAHPAREWRRLGIPLAIGTDDPGVFAIDLVGEYRLLRDELGFGPQDLVVVALQAVEAAFMAPDERSRTRGAFEATIRGLLERLATEEPAS
jgi:adenosine deaminase